jgi:hypothetical protein
VLTQLEDCRAGTQVPPAVAETIRRIDEKFRLLGGTDTLSWSFGVNPCRAHMFFEATKAHRRLTEDELSACGRSLLEAALSATAPPRR